MLIKLEVQENCVKGIAVLVSVGEGALSPPALDPSTCCCVVLAALSVCAKIVRFGISCCIVPAPFASRESRPVVALLGVSASFPDIYALLKFSRLRRNRLQERYLVLYFGVSPGKIMLARKRMGRSVWCGEVAARSPEHDHRSKTDRRGNGGKSKSSIDVDEASSGELCKRVMVVVDQSQESKLALQWALSHVVQQLDVITLLHVQPVTPRVYTSNGTFFNAKAAEELRRQNEVEGWELANAFKTLCATCRPDVEVEILVVEGEKGPTIVGQARKLEASVLVIGQRKPPMLWRLLKRKKDRLADYCIQNSDCLTLAVRKKSRRLGGYLINSQWQKNFWLLA